MKILLAPHNDDEALFCSYTILRSKPLVIIVTDSRRQDSRSITAEERRQESIEAMKILGANVVFLGIYDTELTEDNLLVRLRGLEPEIVYAPAVYPFVGNNEHNIVGRVAELLWKDRLAKYATYRVNNLTLGGDIPVEPTILEQEIKKEALSKYKSQLVINRQHFDAVKDKPEFYII